MLARLGVLGLLGALLAGAAVQAGAAPNASGFTAAYRIVGATHTSSARESDPPIYTGTSTATWSLAPATKKAPNLITVTSIPAFTTGLGTVNVRGVFNAVATTNRTNGHCSLTAPTGSKKYPAVAPGPFPIAVGPDPKSKSRVLVVFGPGGDVRASLSNPYFPSECSTSTSGEPDSTVLMLKSVPTSTFRQKTVVIRYAGSTNKEGIAYRWSTTFTLKLINLS